MKSISYLLIFLGFNFFYSQKDVNDANELKNIAVSSSPSQMLLDNAPSIIVAQPYVKAYNVNLNNINDLSFDITPLMINSKFKGWEYYGYYDNFEKYDVFNNLLKATFSLSVKKENDYSNATLGFRTNVITVYNVKKSKMGDEFKKFREGLRNVNSVAREKAKKEIEEKYKDELKNCDSFTGVEKEVCVKQFYAQHDNERQELSMLYVDELSDISSFDFYKVLNNPLLSLDVAAAYNHIFQDESFSKNQSGRVGTWATLKFSKPFDKTYTSFVNGYLFTRYLKDNYYFDKDLQLYSKMNFIDYGARIQVEFKKFSLSYEFIKRDGDLSDERSVGLITYKINENLYLNGGFGKNFEGINGSSFTLLGIAWGINPNNQSLDWKN